MQGRGCRAADCRQGEASQVNTQVEKAALTGEGDPRCPRAGAGRSCCLSAFVSDDAAGSPTLEQRKAFIEKFGREPGPNDPVFFDPDKDVPTPIDPARMDADLEKAIQDAGFDAAKAQPSESCCVRRPYPHASTDQPTSELCA